MSQSIELAFSALRLQSCNFKTPAKRLRTENFKLEIKRQFNTSIATPKINTLPLLAILKISLEATAKDENDSKNLVEFKSEYTARFKFKLGTTEKEASNFIKTTDNNTILISQALPMAIEHLKSQLMFAGYDSSNIDLGIFHALGKNTES